MTKLIVALDVDYPPYILWNLLHKAGVEYYKINNRLLLQQEGLEFMEILGQNVFLDLKLNDTQDTISAVAKVAFQQHKIKFLTVRADPVMLAAANAQRISDNQVVVAVDELTDSDYDPFFDGPDLESAQGLICPAACLDDVKKIYRDKIVICPGIRNVEDAVDNHIEPRSPAYAKQHGADYIVVGRPIINARHPDQAAKIIMQQLDN